MNADRLNWVLVVEDDAAIQERLHELLNFFGYRATGVGSIAQTLALSNLSNFKTNLLDWLRWNTD